MDTGKTGAARSLAVLLAAGALLFHAAFPSHAQDALALRGLERNAELEQYVQAAVVEKYRKPEDASLLSVRRDANAALNAMGFYAARIDVRKEKDKTVLDVEPGDSYRIRKIAVEGYRGAFRPALESGDPLLAEKILAEQKKLRDEIRESACYYAFAVRHRVVLDHQGKTGDVTFQVEVGPAVTFGKTLFHGGNGIDRAYLRRFVRYREGECWNAGKLEETKEALLATGLVSLVQEKLPEKAGEGQAVDIVFELKKRAPRTVRLGASYYTDEGAGMSAKWMHRNFLGSAEELTAEIKATMLAQSLGLDFSKPHFRRDDQKLSLSTSMRREDSDAFEELSFNSEASLSRKMSQFWSGNLGIAAEVSEVTDGNKGEESNMYGLLSMPGSLTFDNRDDVLDPHRGLFAKGVIEPYVDAFGEASPFVKSRLTASTYFDLGGGKIDPVLALRGSIGGIAGGGTQDIPASKRFFAGGGNSVRGFGYQQAGPVENGDPTGGRSIVETSAEMRFKITGNVGAAAFVDAGNVFDSPFPNLEGGLFIGAGVGLRYHTDFGPIRFDVAVPMNKKENLDQKFQIYISIGQAF